MRQRGPHQLAAGSTFEHVFRTKQPICLADAAAEGQFFSNNAAKFGGARSYMAVPMLRKGEPIGAIAIYRQEVRPFNEKQVELVSSFAKQAVIAIENTRLLNELRQRTDDLSESLEQQTATAEVLRVISRSPGELEPVFQTMLANAMRICEAKFGHLVLYDGEGFHGAYLHDVPQAYRELWDRGPVRPGPKTGLRRVLDTKQVVHIADLAAEPAYAERDPLRVATVEIAGGRTFLGVPMLKENQLLGAIIIYRQDVRPFTDKQIELAQTFADQAVIAIENVRLFDEVQARTRELSESLEQQTATAEILSVISNSLNDTQPVFDAIVESGLKLFPGATVIVALADGDKVDAAAVAAPDPAGIEAVRRRLPIPLTREYMHSAAILDARIVDIPDAENPPTELAVGARNFLATGYRAVTIMPMMRGDFAIGTLSVARVAPGPLSDKQRAVLKTFANQAVIAIENTRLLNELRESLQQQTATADVLKVISRSTFDLTSVLHTLVESAAQLCDADKATITRKRGGAFYRSEAYGFSPEFIEYVKEIPIELERGTAHGRALLEGKVVHIHDVLIDPEYTWAKAQELGNFRTMLAVPMMREGLPIGVLGLTRSDVRPFTEKQI
jgi:two-component system, NtrC family, sensor kinase